MEYQSETIGALAAALAKAQSKFTFAAKSAEAPLLSKGRDGKTYQSGKRTYADLQSIIDAVREGLTSNGIAVIQAPMPSKKDGILLRTTLAHESGEWIASELELPNDRMGGVQGMGSALTYARRYALAAMVGIAQDDDDGETAMAEVRKAEKLKHEAERAQAKANNPTPPTKKQFDAFWALMKQRHPEAKTKEELVNIAYSEAGNFTGREIRSVYDMTKDEVSDFLNACNNPDNIPDNPFM